MRIDEIRTSPVAATVSGAESSSDCSSTSDLLQMAQNTTDSSWDWLKAKADEKLRAEQSKPVEIAFLQELSNFLDEPNVPLPVKQHDALGATSGKESGRSASLQWWAMNFGQYPILWRFAINYLAIPATSVSKKDYFIKQGSSSLNAGLC